MAEQWTFLSNHGRVLLVIAEDPDVRLRDVAASVGITERAVQMIVADLEERRLPHPSARRTPQPLRGERRPALPPPARGRPSGR